ncbi:MAG: ATP-binding protein [Bacteroidaceae bacterium]|nr:ATP-binding protein [Bacteroidaceae bacterium]
MIIRFEPIKERCAEIIEKLMASPDMPQDESALFRIRLCVEEAVVNIVEYASWRIPLT